MAETKMGCLVGRCSLGAFLVLGLLEVLASAFLVSRSKIISISSIESFLDFANFFPILSNMVAYLTLVVNFVVVAGLVGLVVAESEHDGGANERISLAKLVF